MVGKIRMFGLLRRNDEPVGPFEFGHSLEIERPAADVYALIDWGDPRNAKRALGNKVERIGRFPERYRLHLDMVPDHRFEMTVTEAVPGETYAFETEIAPPVGRLVCSDETYVIEPTGANSCRLGLLVRATFTGGMSEKGLAREIMVMTASCGNALAKLKVQAEQGTDAVHRIEALQME